MLVAWYSFDYILLSINWHNKWWRCGLINDELQAAKMESNHCVVYCDWPKMWPLAIDLQRPSHTSAVCLVESRREYIDFLKMSRWLLTWRQGFTQRRWLISISWTVAASQMYIPDDDMRPELSGSKSCRHSDAVKNKAADIQSISACYMV